MSLRVWEKEGTNYYDSSIRSILLRNRIVFLTGEVLPHKSMKIVEQFIYLDTIEKSPITFYINSPGGSVTDGLAIYDTMQGIESPVYTVCIGQAASMGAVLLCAGEKKHRYALPNSEIMIHQPSWDNIGGKQSDVAIDADWLKKMRRRLEEIMAKHCDMPIEAMHKLCEKDCYLTAEDAKKIKLIDKVQKVLK